MLRIVWRSAFVCVVLAALTVGTGVLGVLAPRPLDADEGKRVRLLVKCDQGELSDVLAALAQTRAEVWDLGTMKRLTPTVEKPAPTVEKAEPRGPIPPLRDAGRVMEEILATVAAVVPTVKGRPPHVDGMAVKPRAAIIELDAVAGADIDNVRKALAANPWLAARLEEIVSGEFRRRANGLVGGRLVLKFDTARPEPGQAVHLDQLDMQAFERVLRPHKLSFRFAGAVQKDANRKAGHITTAREYHLDKATLAQLRALLKDIPKAQPGLVPFEVRWKDDGRRIINKPILRVGGRAPAAP